MISSTDDPLIIFQIFAFRIYIECSLSVRRYATNVNFYKNWTNNILQISAKWRETIYQQLTKDMSLGTE